MRVDYSSWVYGDEGATRASAYIQGSGLQGIQEICTRTTGLMIVPVFVLELAPLVLPHSLYHGLCELRTVAARPEVAGSPYSTKSEIQTNFHLHRPFS